MQSQSLDLLDFVSDVLANVHKQMLKSKARSIERGLLLVQSLVVRFSFLNRCMCSIAAEVSITKAMIMHITAE